VLTTQPRSVYGQKSAVFVTETVDNYAGFQVFTAVSIKFRVLWDVASCSHVEVDRPFRGEYSVHQGDSLP
jgi:hypothetical protein